jgi:hypothetical protein
MQEKGILTISCLWRYGSSWLCPETQPAVAPRDGTLRTDVGLQYLGVAEDIQKWKII